MSWWDDWGELIVLCGVVLGVVVVMLISVGFLVNIVARVECREKTANTGVQSRYSALGGCQVEVKPGMWVPLTNWRVVD